MKKFHEDSFIKKMYSKFIFGKRGIDVNMQTGIIEYNQKEKTKIDCNALYLLRHGHTGGTQENKFMSDISENAHICKKGILRITELEGCCEKYDFDIVIRCSDIARVVETTEIFRLVNPKTKYIYKNQYKGINNKGWEGRDFTSFEGKDLLDFEEREIKHNIFAKSSKGESWNQVIKNCLKLIKYINRNHKGKRILLIGQGSIIKGIEILIGSKKTPWEGYNVRTLYNFEKQNPKDNYGTISCIFDKNEEKNK